MNIILDVLFPKKCVGCKKEGSYSEPQRGASSAYFCTDCVSNILQTDLVCPRCEKLAVGGQTHPICKDKFGLDGLWSLGIYDSPLKEAIQTLKYKRVPELAEILVNITLEYWARYQPFVFDQIKKDMGEGWVVIPIPLHWWRENDRGFNQSSQIAKLIAEKLGLKYVEGLKRIRYTKFQAKLKKDQRRANIFRAFEISPNCNLSTLNCLLIDDVWTTGSTLRECCYILKRNGAKKVWAITLAR